MRDRKEHEEEMGTNFKEVGQISIKKMTFDQRCGKTQKPATWIPKREVLQVKTRRWQYARNTSAIARRPAWLEDSGVGDRI